MVKIYITSLKGVIAGKSLNSARLNIDGILHFVFYDKILQIYRRYWVRKFWRHILSKNRQNFKKSVCAWGLGVGVLRPSISSARPWVYSLSEAAVYWCRNLHWSTYLFVTSGWEYFEKVKLLCKFENQRDGHRTTGANAFVLARKDALNQASP